MLSFSASGAETESVKSSCALAKLWATESASLSRPSVSYVFDAEKASVLAQESF